MPYLLYAIVPLILIIIHLTGMSLFYAIQYDDYHTDKDRGSKSYIIGNGRHFAKCMRLQNSRWYHISSYVICYNKVILTPEAITINHTILWTLEPDVHLLAAFRVCIPRITHIGSWGNGVKWNKSVIMHIFFVNVRCIFSYIYNIKTAHSVFYATETQTPALYVPIIRKWRHNRHCGTNDKIKCEDCNIYHCYIWPNKLPFHDLIWWHHLSKWSVPTYMRHVINKAAKHFENCIDALWTRDVLWISMLSLTKVMACCLSTPSHHPKQCWFTEYQWGFVTLC